jgi:hypothetical protein
MRTWEVCTSLAYVVQLQVRPKSIHFIVETSVSVTVGNSGITSKVPFLWSDDEDIGYLVELHCSPTHLLQEQFTLKVYRFCGKNLCLGIVVGKYPMSWDNLQSSTCLIWNRFVTFYTSPIFQMLRKDLTWLGVPYHGFISTDLMELFSE